MIVDTLVKLFNRDLEKLVCEIEQYEDENAIWLVKGQIKNSAGNLCLHLVGNLNTYIGKELGKTGYVRKREEEFSLKNIPKKELIQKIKDTIDMINRVFSHFESARLEEEYPVLVFEKKTSTGYFMIHLATHLSYHLGQVNYHRRLISASDDL